MMQNAGVVFTRLARLSLTCLLLLLGASKLIGDVPLSAKGAGILELLCGIGLLLSGLRPAALLVSVMLGMIFAGASVYSASSLSQEPCYCLGEVRLEAVHRFLLSMVLLGLATLNLWTMSVGI